MPGRIAGKFRPMTTPHRIQARAVAIAILAAAACGNPDRPAPDPAPTPTPATAAPPAEAADAGSDASATVAEPAPAGFPAMATQEQRAILEGSPEEPPPEARFDDQHYVHSNEQHHELFFPWIEGAGQGYVGVGSDQNYTLLASARSEWVWLMDYDTVVNHMHRAALALVLASKDAEDYMGLWTKERSDEAQGIIGKAWADRADAKDILKVYRDYRAMTEAYNERKVAQAGKEKCAFWLHDEGSFGWVEALAAAGRIRILRGNLLEEISLRGIGKAAADLGTAVRVVYLSDAESFFHYDQDFRDNFASLPMDGSSVIVRTASGNFFGKDKADYQWHYNVHSGQHFAGMLATNPKFVRVGIALKQGKPTGVEGVTTTGMDSQSPATPTAPAPAPAAPAAAPEQPAGPSPEATAAGCGKVPGGMACVPGGWFMRGADDSDPDRKPYARVWVSTFLIDTYEVTNALFDPCIKAGACEKHEIYKGFMGPDQPAVGITWWNAHAFCEWAGKRLPSEAEWEKAARGPDGDPYPWGKDPPTCARAQFRGCMPETTLPVGSFPAGHYGIFDMAGNGYEWVQDWYSKCYGSCEGGCGGACPERDPKGPCDGQGGKCPGFKLLKVLRGGSWFWPADQIMASWRRPMKQDSGEHRLSVRCAMSIPDGGTGG